MRPRFIIIAGETLETALLRRQVQFGRRHRLQQSEMEAFVPAVLLGMAGIDALVTDAQLDPPGRQRRQSRDARSNSGRASSCAVLAVAETLIR